MKITVLGCGSSTGVPIIGNKWGNCDPNEPRNRRRRASILVEGGGARVLVDTSPDLRAQALDAGFATVDAVLYTHGHADHTHGIDDLRALNQNRGDALPIYGDAATLEMLKDRFGYAFQPRPDEGPWWYRPSLIANPIDGPFSLSHLSIIPFEQQHGRITTLGFRFGAFAYSPDVNGLSDAAFETLAGIDTWLVDCLRDGPTPGHASLSMTLEWIARLKPRRSILTHMSPELDYRTLCDTLPPGVEPAYDGMVIELPDQTGEP
jgi:phosphoribosyl 1,2-cyclic phosphate phosphodiesterase